jgi:cell division protein FtsZ
MHAEAGLEALRECVDTVHHHSQRAACSTIIDRKTGPDPKRSPMADDVLRQAIQGSRTSSQVPGPASILDFAGRSRPIMSGMGVAMMGTGIRGRRQPRDAGAQKAVSSPLLEDASVNGAAA